MSYFSNLIDAMFEVRDEHPFDTAYRNLVALIHAMESPLESVASETTETPSTEATPNG